MLIAIKIQPLPDGESKDDGPARAGSYAASHRARKANRLMFHEAMLQDDVEVNVSRELKQRVFDNAHKFVVNYGDIHRAEAG